MRVLLTGANGYVGAQLLKRLVQEKHEVFALVRSQNRFSIPEEYKTYVRVVEGDLLNPDSLKQIPEEVDAAYYLVHSMSQSAKNFLDLETKAATHFQKRMADAKAKQIIYLSGLTNEKSLSKHLLSRKRVGEILSQGITPVTILKAGIIIGSGSASFEIIRDLVEKLPVMVAPKWINNLTQPIAISDVLDYLISVLGNTACLGQDFEIGGPDILSYKELLLQFADFRKVKRLILVVPVLTPRLSSYWLYFVTSASFPLAQALVESLKNNAICKETKIHSLVPKTLLTYRESISKAFDLFQEDNVIGSFRDSFVSSGFSLESYIQVPKQGVFSDLQIIPFKIAPEVVLRRIWSLGGNKGWLFMNWIWALRGFIDQLFQGIGLRRGRTHPTMLKMGDALDFWRVVVADKNNGRLLLFAEMRLPGEAWLEFVVIPQKVGGQLRQTATFRPRGLLGRIYWIGLWPIHWFIFRGLALSLCENAPE